MFIKVATDQIKVGDRARKDLGDIDGLAESISDVGLINPVTIDTNYNLIAGERRFRAMQKLGWTEIPCMLRDTFASDTLYRMIELEENVRRKDMDWKERVTSVAEIHRARTREAHLDGEKWAMRHTGALLNMSHGKVEYCLLMADLLAKPDHPVQKADSLRDALRILLQEKEDEAKRIQVASSLTAVASDDAGDLAVAKLIVTVGEAVGEGSSELVQSALADIPDMPPAPDSEVCIACGGTGRSSKGETCPICHGQGAGIVADEFKIPLSRMLFKADSLVWLKNAPAESVDHIVSDPPYAIDVEMMQQEAQALKDVELTAAEHEVLPNMALLANFLPLAYRALKPGGFCVLWCDQMRWYDLYNWAEAEGFKVQRWPLVWVKTGSCMNSAPGYNFTKSTEIAIVMRKGNATLAQFRPSNWMQFGGADKTHFSHPFAKPVELLEWIIRGVAHPGQSILDPFMGSGTVPYATVKCGCSPIGIEINELFYNEAVNNMINAYTLWMTPRKVRFS